MPEQPRVVPEELERARTMLNAQIPNSKYWKSTPSSAFVGPMPAPTAPIPNLPAVIQNVAQTVQKTADQIAADLLAKQMQALSAKQAALQKVSDFVPKQFRNIHEYALGTKNKGKLRLAKELVDRYTSSSRVIRMYQNDIREFKAYFRNQGFTPEQIQKLGKKIQLETKAYSDLLAEVDGYNGTVYRGIRLEGNYNMRKLLRDYKEGSFVEWKAMASTSVNESTARGFSGGVIFEIKLKNNGVLIEDWSNYRSEREVITKARAKFFVSKIVKENSGFTRVYLEEAPDAVKAKRIRS